MSYTQCQTVAAATTNELRYNFIYDKSLYWQRQQQQQLKERERKREEGKESARGDCNKRRCLLSGAAARQKSSERHFYEINSKGATTRGLARRESASSSAAAVPAAMTASTWTQWGAASAPHSRNRLGSTFIAWHSSRPRRLCNCASHQRFRCH